MTDILDLAEHDTTLRRVASTKGGEWAGACPLCGGSDRLRVWPNTDRPGWWCRQCERGGDAIQWLREVRHLSYPDACAALGQEPTEGRATPVIVPPARAHAPAGNWQALAGAFVAWTQDNLWNPAHDMQLDYLASRGLNAATVHAAGLGFNPTALERSRAAWGLEPSDKYGDRLWLPAGIIIPHTYQRNLWKVQIRRTDTDDPKKRYMTVNGSSNALYNASAVRPNKPVIMVEGGIDALVIHQRAGDLITPVAAGKANARCMPWHGVLAIAGTVLLGFDADESGDQAAAWWELNLTDTRRWRPLAKDPGAMAQTGLDIRGWIEAAL